MLAQPCLAMHCFYIVLASPYCLPVNFVSWNCIWTRVGWNLSNNNFLSENLIKWNWKDLQEHWNFQMKPCKPLGWQASQNVLLLDSLKSPKLLSHVAWLPTNRWLLYRPLVGYQAFWDTWVAEQLVCSANSFLDYQYTKNKGWLPSSCSSGCLVLGEACGLPCKGVE